MLAAERHAAILDRLAALTRAEDFFRLLEEKGA